MAINDPIESVERKCVNCVKMRIEIDKDKCVSCGTCKYHCPKGGKIWNIEEKAKAKNLRYCLGCIECASKCPQRAIEYIRCGMGCH